MKFASCIPVWIVLTQTITAAVISIDFGLEWMKIGLVKPSVPFDIVLNRDSKRKTQTVVTIRQVERTFGTNGYALGMRFPQDAFADLKQVLGRSYHSEAVQNYIKNHYTRVSMDSTRNTTQFTSDNGSVYRPEDLVAMLFQYAREEAETSAKESIKDTVITIPPYFNQFQRQAILDAAEIAGLNVLSLLHDGSAVALNYAMTRTFELPQTNLILDVGSGNAVATLAKFSHQTVKEGRYRRNVTFTAVEVLSTGYDTLISGQALDRTLQSLLISKFVAKHSDLQTRVEANRRAMVKLMKEANRIKHILSANNEISVSIESLHEDKDLKTSVTRAEFEEASKELFSRTLLPIQNALTSANLTIDQIHSVVLVGGSVRIPKIQDVLKQFVGAERVRSGVNGDEAAAIGATFYGAKLSSQFKVKDIRLKEVTSYDLEAHLNPNSEDPIKNGRRVPLYTQHTKLVDRKMVATKFLDDFQVTLQYPRSNDVILKEYGCNALAIGQTEGIAAAVKEYADQLIEPMKVKLPIEMSSSGILSVGQPFSQLQRKPELTTDSQTTTSETSATTTTKNKAEKKAKDTKQLNDKLTFNVTVNYPCFPPLDAAAKLDSSQKLQALNNLDKEKFARDEAYNNLESFIYGADDFLEKEDVQKVSTPTEREALQEAVKLASEWLEDADLATRLELETKLKTLTELRKPIQRKVKEFRRRPEAIHQLKEALNNLPREISALKGNLTEPSLVQIEKDQVAFQAVVDSAQAWLDDAFQQLKTLDPTQSSNLTVKAIEKQQDSLQQAKFEFMVKILKAQAEETKKLKRESKKKASSQTDPTSSADSSETTGTDSSKPNEEPQKHTENAAKSPEKEKETKPADQDKDEL